MSSTSLGSRRNEGMAPAVDDIHRPQRRRLGMGEEAGSVIHTTEHRLRHAIVQSRRDPLDLGAAQRPVSLGANVVGDGALQPADVAQSADTRDVGRLARPRRDGAEARRHEEQSTRGHGAGKTRPVGQQAVEKFAVAIA